PVRGRNGELAHLSNSFESRLTAEAGGGAPPPPPPFSPRDPVLLVIPGDIDGGDSFAIRRDRRMLSARRLDMQRRDFLRWSVLTPFAAALRLSSDGIRAQTATRKILIAGGNYGTPFIRYMATLTGKKRPKLLYLPTASADGQSGIIAWYKSCAPIDVYPLVQESFIASSRQAQSWEDVLLSVDGIVASGGNTLNQQAIWKAQGVDVILRQAWDGGMVVGGAARAGVWWFEEGTTDSRPKQLTAVKCLGFLKGSHCPHYDREPDRRPLYQKLIASGEMKPGYALANDAGIYFEGNEVKRVVATRKDAKVYYVTASGGHASERVLEPEMID